MDDCVYSKWFCLASAVKNSSVTIYHFYAEYCKSDCLQTESVKGFDNVFLFSMPTEKHGKSLPGVVYPRLLTKRDGVLQKYSSSHKGRIKNISAFSVKIAGTGTMLKYFTKKLKERLKKVRK